jgi:hopanoid biosynthesis associated protein HpnK
MVGAPAAADAVARAKRLPGLRVGLHLVLVEGRPVLPPDQVPDLLDDQGRFRDDMLAAALAMVSRPRVRRQLAAEIEAQFAAYAATGLALDHADAHKHFHLHPTIAGLMLVIGRRYGLRAMRVPIEPARVLRAIEPAPPRLADVAVAGWARLMRGRLRAAGMRVADQVFGLAWSGAMNESRLAGLLAHLPEGLTEIYAHPASRGGFAGSAPGYGYAEEFAALTAPAVCAAAAASGAARGGFGDFPRR